MARLVFGNFICITIWAACSRIKNSTQAAYRLTIYDFFYVSAIVWYTEKFRDVFNWFLFTWLVALRCYLTWETILKIVRKKNQSTPYIWRRILYVSSAVLVPLEFHWTPYKSLSGRGLAHYIERPVLNAMTLESSLLQLNWFPFPAIGIFPRTNFYANKSDTKYAKIAHPANRTLANYNELNHGHCSSLSSLSYSHMIQWATC